MNLITELNFRGVAGQKISDITGLQEFTNLKILNLTNNNITDITPISQLEYITSLDLSNNINIKIYNSQTKECYLPNKINIKELNIASTNNNDINFITQLPKLRILNLSNNGISSTSELTNLSQIETLDLSYNTAIVKIDDILSLSTLKNLNISTTGITSLLHSKSEEGEDENGIFVLEKLEELNVANNQLVSIEPILKTYMEVVERDEEGNPINEEEKAHLEKLKQLNFNYTGQQEIDYDKLILLKELTHLYMRGNEISEVSNQITKLDNLEYINLSDNLLENINMFVREEYITEDDIIGYDSDEKPILKNNSKVVYIYDDDGNVEAKRIWLKATKIELAHNKITDITPLEYFKQDIKYLDLSENAVYDISLIDNGKFSFSEGLKLQKQGTGWNEPIYYMYINDKNVNVNQYIILPTLFQNSKKEGSKLYSPNVNFTGTNLEINMDEDYQVPGYYNVIIGYDKTENDLLKVSLSGGCADGSTLYFKISEDDISIDSEIFNDANLVSAITSEISEMGEYTKSALKIINVYSYVFNNINKLDLGNKSITDITGLASFKNLKYLYLSNNNISSIEDLKDNTIIKELYLSNNQNLKDNNSAIQNMISLNKLDLSNTGLTKLDNINILMQNINNVEQECNVEYLGLSGNQIYTIEGIEKITSLKELYVSNIGVKDISKISALENLKTLNASGNKIENLESLRRLKNLRYLNISNNNIDNIEPISNIALDELDFSINRVKDITSLTKSYTKLTMDSNLINDISIFEGMRIQNFSVANQKLTHTVKQGDTGNITIELPELLKLSQKSGSKVYTDKGFILTNCELTADKKMVKVNVEALKNQIATVKINGGNAHNTTFSIAEPLEGTIKYEPSNEISTNMDITASITFNRKNVTITNNDGKDTFTFTENGEFIFKYMDENGFEGETLAKVSNIDKTPPQGTITQEVINKKVNVKIELSEPIVSISGWEVSEDGFSITKTYSEDANETLVLTDNVGNTSEINVAVEIDTTPPTITGVENDKLYSQSVIPIIEDKNLDKIKLTQNDTEILNYESGTAITESGKYVLIATDKFQNETIINFEIDVSGVIISTTDQVKITENEAIGEETKSIIRISIPKMTVNKIKEYLKTEMEYEILNTQGELVYDDACVGTGYQIKMESGKTYTIIVYGDITGDGEISISELAVASRIASNPEMQIEKIKFMALDVSKDGQITVPDLAALSRLRNTY